MKCHQERKEAKRQREREERERQEREREREREKSLPTIPESEVRFIEDQQGAAKETMPLEGWLSLCSLRPKSFFCQWRHCLVAGNGIYPCFSASTANLFLLSQHRLFLSS